MSYLTSFSSLLSQVGNIVLDEVENLLEDENPNDFSIARQNNDSRRIEALVDDLLTEVDLNSIDVSNGQRHSDTEVVNSVQSTASLELEGSLTHQVFGEDSTFTILVPPPPFQQPINASNLTLSPLLDLSTPETSLQQSCIMTELLVNTSSSIQSLTDVDRTAIASAAATAATDYDEVHQLRERNSILATALETLRKQLVDRNNSNNSINNNSTYNDDDDRSVLLTMRRQSQERDNRLGELQRQAEVMMTDLVCQQQQNLLLTKVCEELRGKLQETEHMLWESKAEAAEILFAKECAEKRLLLQTNVSSTSSSTSFERTEETKGVLTGISIMYADEDIQKVRSLLSEMKSSLISNGKSEYESEAYDHDISISTVVDKVRSIWMELTQQNEQQQQQQQQQQRHLQQQLDSSALKSARQELIK
jgi:hypothetical protein